jgi:hypothetical protein
MGGTGVGCPAGPTEPTGGATTTDEPALPATDPAAAEPEAVGQNAPLVDPTGAPLAPDVGIVAGAGTGPVDTPLGPMVAGGIATEMGMGVVTAPLGSPLVSGPRASVRPPHAADKRAPASSTHGNVTPRGPDIART